MAAVVGELRVVLGQAGRQAQDVVLEIGEAAGLGERLVLGRRARPAGACFEALELGELRRCRQLLHLEPSGQARVYSREFFVSPLPGLLRLPP